MIFHWQDVVPGWFGLTLGKFVFYLILVGGLCGVVGIIIALTGNIWRRCDMPDWIYYAQQKNPNLSISMRVGAYRIWRGRIWLYKELEAKKGLEWYKKLRWRR